MWFRCELTVDHSVSSSPGAEPEPEPAGHTEPAEPRGPGQHTATEPPAGRHTQQEELIPNRTCRTSSCTPTETQQTSEPTDIINRTRQMEPAAEPKEPADVSGSQTELDLMVQFSGAAEPGASRSSWSENLTKPRRRRNRKRPKVKSKKILFTLKMILIE